MVPHMSRCNETWYRCDKRDSLVSLPWTLTMNLQTWIPFKLLWWRLRCPACGLRGIALSLLLLKQSDLSGCHLEVSETEFLIQYATWSPLKADSVLLVISPRGLKDNYCIITHFCTLNTAPPQGQEAKLHNQTTVTSMSSHQDTRRGFA